MHSQICSWISVEALYIITNYYYKLCSQIEVTEHSNCRLVPYWREFLGVSRSWTWSDTPFANTYVSPAGAQPTELPRPTNALLCHRNAHTSVSSLPGRSQPRSAAAGQLVVPFSKTTTLEDKGFVISGPSTWKSVIRAAWSKHVSVLFQKASENFSVSDSMNYHAIYAVSFIINLILTVNCRTVSRSVHCPFVMACH